MAEVEILNAGGWIDFLHIVMLASSVAYNLDCFAKFTFLGRVCAISLCTDRPHLFVFISGDDNKRKPIGIFPEVQCQLPSLFLTFVQAGVTLATHQSIVLAPSHDFGLYRLKQLFEVATFAGS